jgi:hypothetical protein
MSHHRHDRLAEEMLDEDNPEHDQIGRPSEFPAFATQFIPDLIAVKGNPSSQIPAFLPPDYHGCLAKDALKELLYWETLVSFAQAVNTLRRLVTNPRWAVELVDFLRDRASHLRSKQPGDVDALILSPNHLEAVWRAIPPGSTKRYWQRLKDIKDFSDQNSGDFVEAIKKIPLGRAYNNIDASLKALLTPTKSYPRLTANLWSTLLIGVAFLEGQNGDAINGANMLRATVINQQQGGMNLPPPPTRGSASSSSSGSGDPSSGGGGGGAAGRGAGRYVGPGGAPQASAYPNPVYQDAPRIPPY